MASKICDFKIEWGVFCAKKLTMNLWMVYAVCLVTVHQVATKKLVTFA